MNDENKRMDREFEREYNALSYNMLVNKYNTVMAQKPKVESELEKEREFITKYSLYINNQKTLKKNKVKLYTISIASTFIFGMGAVLIPISDIFFIVPLVVFGAFPGIYGLIQSFEIHLNNQENKNFYIKKMNLKTQERILKKSEKRIGELNALSRELKNTEEILAKRISAYEIMNGYKKQDSALEVKKDKNLAKRLEL